MAERRKDDARRTNIARVRKLIKSHLRDGSGNKRGKRSK